MPCRSEGPTGNEIEITRQVRLLVYVYGSIGQAAPDWLAPLQVMWQTMFNDEYKVPERDMKRLLCSLVRRMDGATRDRVLYDGRKPLARELATWWERHEQEDERRIEGARARVADARRDLDEAERELEREIADVNRHEAEV